MQAGIKYEVDISGALRKLKAVGVAINRTQLLNAIGSRQLTWVMQNFDQQGGKDGSPRWAPLRPNTLASRGSGAMILQDKGDLKKGFDYLADGEGVNMGVLRNTRKGTLSIKDIARYHEYGTGPYIIRPKNKKALAFTVMAAPTLDINPSNPKMVVRFVRHPGLPARPMLPPRQIAERLAVDLIEARIKKAAHDDPN